MGHKSGTPYALVQFSNRHRHRHRINPQVRGGVIVFDSRRETAPLMR